MRMFDDRFQSCKFTRSLDLLFEHVIILQPKKYGTENEYKFASHLVFHFWAYHKKYSKNVFIAQKV